MYRRLGGMFQRDSSHVLRIWKVKRGTASGEEGQDDEECELELEELELEELKLEELELELEEGDENDTPTSTEAGGTDGAGALVNMAAFMRTGDLLLYFYILIDFRG